MVLLVLLRLAVAQHWLLNVFEIRARACARASTTQTGRTMMASATTYTCANAQRTTVPPTVTQRSTLVYVRRYVVDRVADGFRSDADIFRVEAIEPIVGDVTRIFVG